MEWWDPPVPVPSVLGGSRRTSRQLRGFKLPQEPPPQALLQYEASCGKVSWAELPANAAITVVIHKIHPPKYRPNIYFIDTAIEMLKYRTEKNEPPHLPNPKPLRPTRRVGSARASSPTAAPRKSTASPTSKETTRAGNWERRTAPRRASTRAARCSRAVERFRSRSVGVSGDGVRGWPNF